MNKEQFLDFLARVKKLPKPIKTIHILNLLYEDVVKNRKITSDKRSRRKIKIVYKDYKKFVERRKIKHREKG